MNRKTKVNNVVAVDNLPPPGRVVADMKVGEVAYIAPNAYDARRRHLNTAFVIHSKPEGIATLQVKCVAQNEYALNFAPNGEV